MTEKERFMRRFNERKERDGMADMKFMVERAHELSEEEFFECANEFEAAAKGRGEVDLDTLDKVKPSLSPLLG